MTDLDKTIEALAESGPPPGYKPYGNKWLPTNAIAWREFLTSYLDTGKRLWWVDKTGDTHITICDFQLVRDNGFLWLSRPGYHINTGREWSKLYTTPEAVIAAVLAAAKELMTDGD